MRVCVIVEGAYPYLTGGVSSWLHQLIQNMPDTEFVIQALCAERDSQKDMRYKLPENVSYVYDVYLSDDDYIGGKSKKTRLNKQHTAMMKDLLYGEKVDWPSVFSFFYKKKPCINALLCGRTFLMVAEEYYRSHFPELVFTDFLWAMRSMYLPLFHTLKTMPVKADVYHAVSTGYAGVLASYQSYVYQKPFVLTEHGIYTREREEEIIRAGWVEDVHKELWIEQFRKIAKCGYEHASVVTSLFEGARELQIELGCPPEKTMVIPNGIDVEKFGSVAPKNKNDIYINIGALLRVTPIKDVKTMITAFAIAKEKNNKLKLWIMGPLEEAPSYVEECKELVTALKITDVVFTGPVDSCEYIGRMDFMVLTSLSEGQPLTILEGLAAGKPSIVTNVGSCRELVGGKGKDKAPAGIVTPPMSPEETAKAMLYLADNPAVCSAMGKAGRARVNTEYNAVDMMENYRQLYERLVYADNSEGKDM